MSRYESLGDHRARLNQKAASALVRWRMEWERNYASPPDTNCGFEDILPMWKIAGQLMNARAIKRRFP